MHHEMANLKCIQLSGYKLDPEIKPPKHGPYTTVFDKKKLKKTLKFVSVKCVAKKIFIRLQDHHAMQELKVK